MELSTKTSRIEVVDALRGFAVMAILLVHNLEHFSCLSGKFPRMADYSGQWRTQCNILFVCRKILCDIRSAFRIYLLYPIT